MLSPRRLHIASTICILQVPFFICRYLLLNIQVPFSTHQQAVHVTVLFTLDLLMPYTAFPSLSATVPASILKRFYAPFLPPCTLIRCLVHAMPPQSTKIEHLIIERRVHHLERTVLGRYLLSYHTVNG